MTKELLAKYGIEGLLFGSRCRFSTGIGTLFGIDAPNIAEGSSIDEVPRTKCEREERGLIGSHFSLYRDTGHAGCA